MLRPAQNKHMKHQTCNVKSIACLSLVQLVSCFDESDDSDPMFSRSRLQELIVRSLTLSLLRLAHGLAIASYSVCLLVSISRQAVQGASVGAGLTSWCKGDLR